MTHTDIAEMIQVLRDLIEDGFTAAALAGMETLQRDVEALATHTATAASVSDEHRFRGYANLGIGAYIINHSASGTDPEVVISVATEEELDGRQVGEERDNIPGKIIRPEQMVVRLRFDSVAGLEALESQLRYVREVHFPESVLNDLPSISDEQIAACVKRASTYGVPFVGLISPGGTPSDFSKRFTAEILALRPAQDGDQWREAVEEAFSVNHITMPEDPREAIKKLIATEVRDALDPTISSAAAALVQAGVPEGWKLVPVEPTQAMCQEGQWKAKEWPKFPLRITAIWQAMLAAAPKEGGAA